MTIYVCVFAGSSVQEECVVHALHRVPDCGDCGGDYRGRVLEPPRAPTAS